MLAGPLFWLAMINGRYGRSGYGLGVLYVFLTAIHSSALGALVTVAPSVWYGEYARQATDSTAPDSRAEFAVSGECCRRRPSLLACRG